jgi:hypothetical protein
MALGVVKHGRARASAVFVSNLWTLGSLTQLAGLLDDLLWSSF